jgi:hypothetical protein
MRGPALGEKLFADKKLPALLLLLLLLVRGLVLTPLRLTSFGVFVF